MILIPRIMVATLLFLPFAVNAQSAPTPAAKAINNPPYTMLYVFGDSYSDSGSGYVDGNGPTAVVYLAQRLGIPFTWYGDPHSQGKGLNFAISGAQTGAGAGRRYPTGEFLGYGMKNQVETFVQFSGLGFIPAIDAANTMFFFTGGLNDRGRPDGYTRANLESEIDTLYDLGARRFTVALLPTRIPQFATAGAAFNPELAKIPEEERARHPEIRIGLSNWGLYMDEVMAHPEKYGITDITHPCAGRFIHHEAETPCANPDAHFFYHEGHPSTAVHRIVGEMLYEEALRQAR